MGTKSRQIDCRDLQKIVVLLYETGERFNMLGLTRAHARAGSDLKILAAYLDELAFHLPYEDKITIIPSCELAIDRQHGDRAYGLKVTQLDACNNLLRDICTELGVAKSDVLAEIAKLKNNQKKVRKCNTHK